MTEYSVIYYSTNKWPMFYSIFVAGLHPRNIIFEKEYQSKDKDYFLHGNRNFV